MISAMTKLRNISLGNWIFISMILGLIVGLFLNFYVDDYFIKNIILMDNIFYVCGNGFIKLLRMLVVPLVFFSIVVGVASISDIRKLSKIGGTTIILYMITTTVAVIMAISISNLLQPGIGLSFSNVEQMSNVTFNQTFSDTVLNFIPDNPINSLANGDMIPIIIFAVIIGVVISRLKEETKVVNDFFVQSDRIMMEMTAIIIKFAPIGVFCLMAKTFGDLGLGAILPLIKLIGCVIVCVCIQLFVVYPTLFAVLTKLNPIRFFKKFIPVMIFAFNACSSNATIPINLEKLSELGVNKDVSSFTIPLGATINMDGTSIMQACTVMFAAQAYGFDLGISAIITIIFTTLIASVGTPGVPGGALITLNMVFNSVGLPLSVIGVVYGIDRILNMFCVVANVVGDAMCTIIVSLKNDSMDVEVFNGEKPPNFAEYTN